MKTKMNYLTATLLAIFAWGGTGVGMAKQSKKALRHPVEDNKNLPEFTMRIKMTVKASKIRNKAPGTNRLRGAFPVPMPKTRCLKSQKEFTRFTAEVFRT